MCTRNMHPFIHTHKWWMHSISTYYDCWIDYCCWLMVDLSLKASCVWSWFWTIENKTTDSQSTTEILFCETIKARSYYPGTPCGMSNVFGLLQRMFLSIKYYFLLHINDGRSFSILLCIFVTSFIYLCHLFTNGCVDINA